jgi:hypothetical protein
MGESHHDAFRVDFDRHVKLGPPDPPSPVTPGPSPIGNSMAPSGGPVRRRAAYKIPEPG